MHDYNRFKTRYCMLYHGYFSCQTCNIKSPEIRKNVITTCERALTTIADYCRDELINIAKFSNDIMNATYCEFCLVFNACSFSTFSKRGSNLLYS